MGPRPHLRFFAFKTTTLSPELLVSMGPRPHLSFVHAKQRDFRITSLYGSQPSVVVFAFKTATLAPILQVSMGPSPHLWSCVFTTEPLWPELIVSMDARSHL